MRIVICNKFVIESSYRNHPLDGGSTFGDSRTSHIIKRKLTHQSDATARLTQGGSVESLVVVVGSRLRKISGNASEGGASSAGSHSLRDGVKHAGDDRAASAGIGGAGGDERVVFVSTDRRVPFAVSSVLSFSKGGKGYHRLVVCVILLQ